ncbi:unnamed protein product [Mesocestoides corti]|uniref:Transmembrane protein 242 n=1 Tax=Mesocestoides corti TaxID=53468 RepID=A0A0R3UQX0_MESCO|nr:unnamed protein product [Mesocestoides corti]
MDDSTQSGSAAVAAAAAAAAVLVQRWAVVGNRQAAGRGRRRSNYRKQLTLKGGCALGLAGWLAGTPAVMLLSSLPAPVQPPKATIEVLSKAHKGVLQDYAKNSLSFTQAFLFTSVMALYKNAHGLILLSLSLLSTTFQLPPLHFLHLLLLPPVQSRPVQCNELPKGAEAVVTGALEHSQGLNPPQEEVSVSDKNRREVL